MEMVKVNVVAKDGSVLPSCVAMEKAVADFMGVEMWLQLRRVTKGLGESNQSLFWCDKCDPQLITPWEGATKVLREGHADSIIVYQHEDVLAHPTITMAACRQGD